MLAVEEVIGVSWIQFHRLESFPPLQQRTRPLPYSSYISPSTELVAILGHWGGVKVLEANVATFEVSEKCRWVELRLGARSAFMRKTRRGRDLDAVVGEMPVGL